MEIAAPARVGEGTQSPGLTPTGSTHRTGRNPGTGPGAKRPCDRGGLTRPVAPEGSGEGPSARSRTAG
jgi:hypothetical protein